MSVIRIFFEGSRTLTGFAIRLEVRILFGTEVLGRWACLDALGFRILCDFGDQNLGSPAH